MSFGDQEIGYGAAQSLPAPGAKRRPFRPSIWKSKTSAFDDDSEPIGSVSMKLEEGVPLLPTEKKAATIADRPEQPEFDQSLAHKLYGAVEEAAHRANQQQTMFVKAHNDKVIFYDHERMLTWAALHYMGRSVFVQWPVVKTFCACTLLALFTAASVYMIPDASKIDTGRFAQLCDFLTVFISFMLGIYVQQAFKRWWFSVSAFEKLLISIRQLIFMLHQMKITDEFVEEVEKLCVASTYFLNTEVKTAQTADEGAKHDHHDLTIWLCRHDFLTAAETTFLLSAAETGGVLARTRAIWSFIGEMLSNVDTLGGKVLTGPLETRLISLCQDCLSEIEELRMCIATQTPFMYAHLLACLVHVNNFLLAMTCGMSIGSALNEAHLRHKQLQHANKENSRFHSDLVREWYAAVQVTWVQGLMVFLSPMIHVAFLHIAHLLCYPFGNEAYHLPTETIIAKVHSELHQMRANRKFFRGVIYERKARCLTALEEERHKKKEDDQEEEDEQHVQEVEEDGGCAQEDVGGD